MAQLVARFVRNEEVRGSIPLRSTKWVHGRPRGHRIQLSKVRVGMFPYRLWWRVGQTPPRGSPPTPIGVLTSNADRRATRRVEVCTMCRA